MIRHILLDLDNTILDFQAAEKNALTKALAEQGIIATEEMITRYSAINLSQWKRLEKGEITRAEVKSQRFVAFFAEYGITHIPVEDMMARYEYLLGVDPVFMPYAKEVLEELAKAYSLHLVTNGGISVQKRRIEAAGIEAYFDHVFISEEVGANKPSEAFFEACFDEMLGGGDGDADAGGTHRDDGAAVSTRRDDDATTLKNTCIIVGDSLTSDIQGGMNAGIKTCWYCPDMTADGATAAGDAMAAGDASSYRIDYFCRDLRELPHILGAIS